MTEQRETQQPATVRYIWGAENIGRFLGLNRRQVYHGYDTGTLPLGKLNGRLFADPVKLSEYMDSLIAQ